MPAFTFNGVLIIAAVAVLVPVVLALVPRLPLPGAVVEVIAGIVIGPSVLGWVHLDLPTAVLSDLGLGMLLFLAGLEIDVERLRGQLGRLAVLGFCLSAVIALVIAHALAFAGLASQPLFVAIVLMSTSAGLLLPLLKDAGEEASRFGQLVMTAAAFAEVAPVLLLSLFFSATSSTGEGRVVSLVIFLVLLALLGVGLGRVRQLDALERMLNRLEDRSAQLRVRASLTLALGCGVLAFNFGFASILGAFAAGLLVRMIDLSGHAPHPQFRVKLEGIGFGFLIPIFFIATGVTFNLKALVSNGGALAQIPIFLLALLLARGLPALLYTRFVGRRRAMIAGLMQATTVTFVIVATQIGLAARQISSTTSASLLAAGLLSAAIFPGLSVRLLSAQEPVSATEPLEERF
jgi:Kef-type K+ transport system membrane component KefB